MIVPNSWVTACVCVVQAVFFVTDWKQTKKVVCLAMTYDLRSRSRDVSMTVETATTRMRKAKRMAAEARELESARKRRSLGPKTHQELVDRIGALSATLTAAERTQHISDLTKQFEANVTADTVRKLEKRDPDAEAETDDIDPTTFLALQDYVDEKLRATGKGSSLVDQALRLSGVESLPTPLDFTNLQVSLDHRWWPVVWDDHSLEWGDLSSKFQKRTDGGRLRAAFRNGLEAALKEPGGLLSVDAEAALDRLVAHHVTLACHWLDTEASCAYNEFVLRWDSVGTMCEKDATCIYQDFAARCGLHIGDLTVGQSLRRSRVPAFLQSGVDLALKGLVFRPGSKTVQGRAGNGATPATGDRNQKKRPPAKYDAAVHLVVKDTKGIEWFHSKRPDGTAGRRLGRK